MHHVGVRSKRKNKQTLHKNDDAVSPVIGTILMVAVTVMLAAGVYMWTTVFGGEDSAPEDASMRASGLDLDDDGLNEWIRVTLVSGDDAPYNHDVVGLQLLASDGDILDDSEALCSEPSAVNLNETNEKPVICGASGGDLNATGTWDVGDSLFIPCQGDSSHLVTLKIRGHTVFDNSVECNQPAAEAA